MEKTQQSSSAFPNIINSFLNDSKAIMNSYVYFKKNKDLEGSIELSVSQIPFNGNFAFLSGVDEMVNLIKDFKFTSSDIEFLKENFSYLDEEFFTFLSTLQMDDIVVYGLDNGSEFYKDEPIMVISGPVTKLKLLTFPITNILSFSTLICTNAVRMRLLAGKDKTMFEFGLRRAQGPLAGIFASKYSYIGSFDACSNCWAGYLSKMPVKGTLAHAYIMSYQHLPKDFQAEGKYIIKGKDFYIRCLEIRQDLKWNTNISELISFVSYTSVFANATNLLVDTFNTYESGVKNAIIVHLALEELTQGECRVRGIRLDSGDLAELSKKAKKLFLDLGDEKGISSFKLMNVCASNDINEKSLKMFNEQIHAIDIFGIGTNLVTCQLDPYMVIHSKLTLPSHKKIMRITDSDGKFISEEIAEKIQEEEKYKKERSKLLLRDFIDYNETNLENSREFLLKNLEENKSHLKLDIVNELDEIKITKN
jgi:nicotinate phosphoribosyltransferase